MPEDSRRNTARIPVIDLGTNRMAFLDRREGKVRFAFPQMTITDDEIKALAADFDDPARARANGIRVDGTRYSTLSVDTRSIHARMGQETILAVATQHWIIVGVYDKELEPARETQLVEVLAGLISDDTKAERMIGLLSDLIDKKGR
ncbi:profilin [Nocardia sp. NPDC051030]|uniref:profilin n=1 Tax=Nocardia sp. NPDC051030 TaxID=3155162 RepID=UPI00341D9E0B